MISCRSAVAVVLGTVALALAGGSIASAATPDPRPVWNQAPEVAYGHAHAAPAAEPSSATPSTARPSAKGSASPSGKPSPTAAGSATATATALQGKGMQVSVNTTADGSVALTFDDGPDAQTPQILDLLEQHGVKATFCVVGVNVQAHPDLVRRMVDEGHTLCNHSWKHDLHLGDKSRDTIRTDLQKTNDEIHKAVPDAPIRYFRHPGGNFTVAAVEVSRDLGMVALGWSVDPRDWDIRGNGSGPALAGHIQSVVRSQTRAGSIVLSHDGGGDRSATVAAYRVLLPELKNSYSLVALPTS